MSLTMSASCKFLVLICAGAVAVTAIRAGETSDGKATATTAEQTDEYQNWVELGIGGLIIHGDAAQFKQEHRMSGDVFGGIEDMHWEHTVGKNGTFSIDGRAIFDNDDYNVKVELNQPGIGYIRGGYTEFRSWYDGNGGFFPPGTWFPPPFPEMHVDRGEAWVELGLRVPDWPEITIHYSHEFRDGMKDSTIWGDTNRTGGGNVLPGPTRKIIPSFRDIDETRDIFSFDASKTFGNTDVLLGMRYEHNENDYSLNMERSAGSIGVVPGGQRFVTQHQKDDVDLFSGHGITETRLSDSLWFTTGYSYTTFENDLSGTRIFGTDFDSAFGEPVPTLGQRDHSFINLVGTARVKEHVVNANLFWMPLESLNILTGFRYTHENRDSDSSFLAEEPVHNMPPFTPDNPDGGFHYGPQGEELGFGERMADYDRFAERLEIRYTGIANWLFYAEGEWEEECGHVDEFQTIDEVDEPLDKDTHFLGQKYTIGANWYATMRLTLAARYYHKIASYDTDITTAQFPRLLSQDWNTDDFNIRMTFRPKVPACLGTLTLVTRYDFVRSEIDGQWEVFLDVPPPEVLTERETGVIKKHVISESMTWNPLARFFLQANFSYVFNETDTPASSINLDPQTSPTVVNFRNDYWTVTSGAGYILDDKTNLYADYSFYCANDHFNNSGVAVPYGLGATEHTVSASVTRQMTKSMRLLLKYSYFDYRDSTFGGHNNYRAHLIYSSLQYRF